MCAWHTGAGCWVDAKPKAARVAAGSVAVARLAAILCARNAGAVADAHRLSAIICGAGRAACVVGGALHTGGVAARLADSRLRGVLAVAVGAHRAAGVVGGAQGTVGQAAWR